MITIKLLLPLPAPYTPLHLSSATLPPPSHVVLSLVLSSPPPPPNFGSNKVLHLRKRSSRKKKNANKIYYSSEHLRTRSVKPLQSSELLADCFQLRLQLFYDFILNCDALHLHCNEVQVLGKVWGVCPTQLVTALETSTKRLHWLRWHESAYQQCSGDGIVMSQYGSIK